jgi:hypothetical protein
MRDRRPREYAARRTFEGKSKREAMRCPKRYTAREVCRAIIVCRPNGAAKTMLPD